MKIFLVDPGINVRAYLERRNLSENRMSEHASTEALIVMGAFAELVQLRAMAEYKKKRTQERTAEREP